MKTDIDYFSHLDQIIRAALAEDLGGSGDVTSLAIQSIGGVIKAEIRCKQHGIIAGLPVVRRVFEIVSPDIKFSALVDDGQKVAPGDVVVRVTGPEHSILTAERTALNLLCHLSGIASLTHRFVQAVSGTQARILDTRKTTPGLRLLEKYAVTMGGGTNHRLGLYDMFLIKDNHIAAAGGIGTAVACCRQYARQNHLELKIEVETGNLAEVEEALAAGVDRIMLDNMSRPEIHQAVVRISGQAETEASGNVTLETVAAIAATGVDFISAGAITHSAAALDFSMKIVKN